MSAPAHPRTQADVLIIGGGPAGCSAALWLDEMGLRVALMEQAAQLLPTLADLHLPQNWVLGAPHADTRTLAAQYAQHLAQQPRVALHLGDSLAGAQLNGPHWHITTRQGRSLDCRAVLVCTGVQALPFDNGPPEHQPLDAAALTNQRDHLPPGRFLLLGGGDNAVENALHLAARGHHVTLWARGALRARPQLTAQLAPPSGASLPQQPPIAQRLHQPMPTLRALPGGGWQAHSAAYGTEHFDHAAALFGNRANDSALQLLAQAAGVEPVQLAAHGVFSAGDVAGRWHPCIATAVGDGAHMAVQVRRWLDGASTAAATPPAASLPASGQRLLTLTGLRFAASLGILAHEINAPQPIQVDAQLNLGAQPLHPPDDDITHVLDYRKVRQIIIDECTAEHVLSLIHI